MTTRIVELRQGILKKNDELARDLRGRFQSAGVLVLNLVSSPGTGKTALLERTLRELRESGDGEGERDNGDSGKHRFLDECSGIGVNLKTSQVQVPLAPASAQRISWNQIFVPSTRSTCSGFSRR